MESGFFDKQRIIQTSSDVLWTLQFSRNIPMNDEQYSPRNFT